MKSKLNRCFLVAVLFFLAAACPTSASSLRDALLKAVRHGDTEKVQALLAEGADANAKDNHGWTALITATACGHTDIVRVLLAKGADVNAKDNRGGTALTMAAFYGHTDIVQVLLAKGADVNAKGSLNGGPALIQAASHGHPDIVQVLLAKGADVNAKGNFDGGTALMKAAFKGSTDTVQVLLAKGADVNAKNNNGVTALMWAAMASKGSADTVQLLLAKGADVSVKNNYGLTALMYAASSRGASTETVQLLLAKSADVNAKDNKGRTALTLAAEKRYEGYKEMVQLLKKAGAKAGGGATISVNSADELLNAIGPNRTIQLAPGDYVLSDVKDHYMDFIRWDPEFDGKTITVRNVKNLKIVGSRGEATRLLARPRYVYVLNFEDCENVELANLVMGHSPVTGYCTGGVIGATNCTNLALRNCDLFGSGTEGLTLEKVRNLVFHDSTIRDCTYGIMTIRGCANLQFTQSSFTRNKKFYAVNVHDSKDISFVGCSFTNNHAEDESLFEVASSSNILVKKCNITNNKVKSITNNATAVILYY